MTGYQEILTRSSYFAANRDDDLPGESEFGVTLRHRRNGHGTAPVGFRAIRMRAGFTAITDRGNVWRKYLTRNTYLGLNGHRPRGALVRRNSAASARWQGILSTETNLDDAQLSQESQRGPGASFGRDLVKAVMPSQQAIVDGGTRDDMERRSKSDGVRTQLSRTPPTA